MGLSRFLFLLRTLDLLWLFLSSKEGLPSIQVAKLMNIVLFIGSGNMARLVMCQLCNPEGLVVQLPSNHMVLLPGLHTHVHTNAHTLKYRSWCDHDAVFAVCKPGPLHPCWNMSVF